jgi:hypothetical protein
MISFYFFHFEFNINLLCVEKSNGRLVPNMDVLRKHLLREGPVDKEHLMEIIREAAGFMSKFIIINI